MLCRQLIGMTSECGFSVSSRCCWWSTSTMLLLTAFKHCWTCHMICLSKFTMPDRLFSLLTKVTDVMQLTVLLLLLLLFISECSCCQKFFVKGQITEQDMMPLTLAVDIWFMLQRFTSASLIQPLQANALCHSCMLLCK